MNRILAAAVFVVACLAAAQPVTPTIGPALTGDLQTVNNGVGDQLDPHISGDLVSYTDFSTSTPEIRYQHLATAGSDSAIPNDGAFDIVSDVNGSIIVYTHIVGATEAIFSFDTSTAGPPVELDPLAGSLRTDATIGGPTVAWEDYDFNPSAPQIVAYDRTGGTATQVTNDSSTNVNPAVDSAGDTLAWTKCDSPGTNCHIWSAVKGTSGWTTHQLTSGTGQEELPDTNGAIVAYDSIRSGEQDIYWQPAAGGTEHELAFTGVDRNANVAGNFIAFEHMDPTSATPNWDIYVYDTSQNILYQVTNTPDDEVLNDITIDASGNVRVVWAVQEATNGFNVYAFAFAAPSSGNCSNAPGDGDDDDEDPVAACANPVGRKLLTTLSVTREPHEFETFTTDTFGGTPTRNRGLICLDTETAEAGFIGVDHHLVFGPWDFQSRHGHADCDRGHVETGAHIGLESSNRLDEWIVGQPGTAYTVRVYDVRVSCSDTGGSGSGSGGSGGGNGHHGTEQQQDPLTANAASSAVGCSTGGGDLMIAGLLMLLGMLLVRRPSAVPVRARRR